jgi:steroid delta-isomerase-like uncharacterized protein
MSVAANKELVARFNRATTTDRDLSAVDRYFPPEFLDHTTPDGKSGPEQVKNAIEGYFSAFPDFSAEVEFVSGENDLVVTRMYLSGTHHGPFYGAPPTGKKFRVAAMQVLRVADGRFVERWFWVDMLNLRQQLGLQ